MEKSLKRSLLPLLLSITSLLIAVPSDHAAAEEDDATRDEGWLLKTVEASYFHVQVTGSTPDLLGTTEETRIGKAFAISPDTLIVARHIIGETGEWEPIVLPDSPLSRAHRQIDRSILLTNSSGDYFSDVVVLPTFSDASDAAAIMVPELGLKDFFPLSLCGLKGGQTYFALSLNGDPNDPQSLRSLFRPNPDAPNEIRPVPRMSLTAVGYIPELYGGLYVFDPDDPSVFASGTEGYEGTPILDSRNAVVAFISAVDQSLEADSGLKVFATPILPMIPPAMLQLSATATQAGSDPRETMCSITSLLGEMSDQVHTYAHWTVERELEREAPNGAILIRYNGLAESTAIDYLTVDYAFLTNMPIPGSPDPRLGGDVETVDTGPSMELNTFRLGELAQRACLDIPPETDEKSINYVRLTITPTYVDRRYNGRPVIKYLPWRELVGDQWPGCSGG